jgi:hypothetical protein
MPRDEKLDQEAEETLQRAITFLTREEEQARSPEQAARARSFRHGAEELLQSQHERVTREGMLPCPRCHQWGKVWKAEAGELRCPHCDARIDINELYFHTGVWKIQLVFAIAFTGLFLGLVIACLQSFIPIRLRWIMALGAAPWAVLGALYWQRNVRLAVWKWRQSRRS